MNLSRLARRSGAFVMVFSATLWGSSCLDVGVDRCGTADYSIVETEAVEYIPHIHMEAAHEIYSPVEPVLRKQVAAPLSPVKKVPTKHVAPSSKPVKVVKAKRKGCSIFSTL